MFWWETQYYFRNWTNYTFSLVSVRSVGVWMIVGVWFLRFTIVAWVFVDSWQMWPYKSLWIYKTLQLTYITTWNYSHLQHTHLHYHWLKFQLKLYFLLLLLQFSCNTELYWLILAFIFIFSLFFCLACFKPYFTSHSLSHFFNSNSVINMTSHFISLTSCQKPKIQEKMTQSPLRTYSKIL